ncbi:glycosyltransferase family 4 protein [Vibrio rotiferianus]|uniref:glycosyltransferase family 4 protein n=1 Tax=Vibrio rotiferianus TaxID=190895 RepID=UPI0005F06AAA|nr:glycosyltransferase family 4 protein [Vibrio rotiferianus]
MKVLQVATVATTINAFLLPFAREFRDLGWQVDAAAEGIEQFPDVQNAHDKYYEIGFCRNPFKVRALIQSLIEIRNLLKRERYDVVHVHTPIASFLTRIASIGVGNTKLFYTAHGFHYVKGNPFWKNAIYYLAEKCAGLLTDHLFVINEEDYRFATEKHIASKVSKIDGIGVDMEYFTFSVEDRKVLRGELGIQDGEVMLLHVAELIPRKHHSVMFEALAKMKKTEALGNVKYVVVGSGPLLTELEQLSRQLKLNEHILFLGYRTDVKRLLSASDVLVLSSKQEGLPRCVMEAMSVGKPVIASNIRGNSDLLQSGAGILVELNDVEGWQIAIQELVNSESLRETMGKVGQDLICTRFEESKVIDQVKGVYMNEAIR